MSDMEAALLNEGVVRELIIDKMVKDLNEELEDEDGDGS